MKWIVIRTGSEDARQLAVLLLSGTKFACHLKSAAIYRTGLANVNPLTQSGAGILLATVVNTADTDRMERLKNKVAVITGSGSGLGEGIARLFAEQGARVVISDRNEDAARAVAADLGAGAISQRADVSIEADCRALIDRAVEQFGQLDVLVNTVGWSLRGTLEDTTVEEWDGVFAVNVRSSFICTQQAVKYMKPRRAGSILNIGSVNAYIGEPKLMAYSAAKGALMTLTKNLASSLNQHHIRVNQLNIGWTLTPNENRIKIEEEGKPNWLEDAIATRPFGRLLSPRDVALAALYFASDESALVTGSILDVEQYPVGAPPNW
jgi:NAD(P)-dependent dehydrogenase (short-subunit alcohol dehydrogenase family)